MKRNVEALLEASNEVGLEVMQKN